MPILSDLLVLAPLYEGRRPHRSDGRFYNHPAEPARPFFWRSIYMYLATFAERVAARRAIPSDPPAYQADREDHITWIGHSSFLVKVHGVTILIDPVFDDLTFLMPRLMPNGIRFEDLPPIDIVLITHNHADHMDTRTIKRLYARTQAIFLVPEGDEGWFWRRGMADRVRGCMWWDRVQYQGVEIVFTPAWHWSQRGLWDRNTSLWGGWYISTPDIKIFCAGDTAYGCHFKEINALCGAPDIALLPIGPCEPRAWMRTSHMDADDAGKAFLDLQAHVLIPMHWGTFGFGKDSLMLPVQRLHAWWSRYKTRTQHHHMRIMTVGQSLKTALLRFPVFPISRTHRSLTK